MFPLIGSKLCGVDMNSQCPSMNRLYYIAASMDSIYKPSHKMTPPKLAQAFTVLYTLWLGWINKLK